MPLQYLGVGLSKTATKSLTNAMKTLFPEFPEPSLLHWDKDEILGQVILGNCNDPDFRRIYEPYNFVCDIPHAYFFREIWKAYPALKFILTERNEDEWHESMCKHFAPGKASDRPVERALHKLVYGADFTEFPTGELQERLLPKYLYKKRFRDWNRMIKCVIPDHLLLVMDICESKENETEEEERERGKRLWKMLWDFVGKPTPEPPEEKFPRLPD